MERPLSVRDNPVLRRVRPFEPLDDMETVDRELARPDGMIRVKPIQGRPGLVYVAAVAVTLGVGLLIGRWLALAANDAVLQFLNGH